MDSRLKPSVRMPQSEMPTIGQEAAAPRTNRGLVTAVIVLAVAVLVLAAWIVVERSGTNGEVSEAAAPIAPPKSSERSKVESMFAALDAGDLVAASRYYAKDAVLTTPGGHVVGRDAITQYYVKGAVGNQWSVEVVGPTIGFDEEVAAFVRTEDKWGASDLSLHTFVFRGQKILDHKAKASHLKCWCW